MSTPITPEEARQHAAEGFPREVFDAFNARLKAGGGRPVTIAQAEIAADIARRLGTTTADVYARHLLDVEGAYEAAGWDVHFDKPGYNESYEAVFTFKPRSRR